MSKIHRKKTYSFLAFSIMALLGLALSGCGEKQPSQAEVFAAPHIEGGAGLDNVSAVKVQAPRGLSKDLWTINGEKWSAEQDDEKNVFVVFSYACVHCYNFEEPLRDWSGNREDENVQVVLIPAAMGGIWDEFARAYFAIEQMNDFSLHEELFKQMHAPGGRDVIRQGQAKEIAQFLSSKNSKWSAAQILELMQSENIEDKIKLARSYTMASGITATPTLIVDGRRRVMLTPNHQETLMVVDTILQEKK